MAQPFDYSLNVPTPLEAGAQAFKLGAGIAATEQEALAYKQAQQQKALEQQQAMEQERIRQDAFRRALRPDALLEDVVGAQMLTSNAEQIKALGEWGKTLQGDQAKVAISKIAPIASALASGNAERAVSVLERQIPAYEGNPEAQAAIQKKIDLAKLNPDSAFVETIAELSQLPGGSLIAENILKGTQEVRARKEAERTKLSPSIQEAIDFKNLPPEDKEAFISIKTLGRPPAAVTNVNVTNKLEQGTEAELAKLVPVLSDQASAAASHVSQLPRYRNALNSAITGPLAETRLNANRVASALGFSGDKAVSATSELLQGLAEMALQSRKEMAGQGPITDSEQKLLVRARSGDISFTKSELNTLFDVSERAARAQYKKSKGLLQGAAARSPTADLFLQNVPEMPESSKPAAKPSSVTVRTPDGKTLAFPNQQAADQFKRRAGL
jgi:hypothetical protein